MAVFIGKRRKLRDVDEHRNDKCCGLTRSYVSQTSLDILFLDRKQSIPVSATPITSLFIKPIGMAWRWIGEGSV
jgi:hypothetical protein